jgi:two-component sensor histidine kinase
MEKSDSLGLRLVRALAEQLKGTLEYETNNGTKFKLTFEGE